jgi:hypothetical protein
MQHINTITIQFPRYVYIIKCEKCGCEWGVFKVEGYQKCPTCSNRDIAYAIKGGDV